MIFYGMFEPTHCDHSRYVVSTYGFKTSDKVFDSKSKAKSYKNKLLNKNGIKVVEKHSYFNGKEYVGEDGRCVVINKI